MVQSCLRDQVALVTGGSRGIGRAISLMLASGGAKVYVNYGSRKDAADEVVALIEKNGGEATVIGFDVGDSASVDDALKLIKDECGKIDILVNNAGITGDGLFVRMKDEDWKRILDVNLTGAFYCSRAAAKIMMKARRGTIINISSIVGQMGNAGQASYVASKAGLIGLTKSLARELASRNVTVNAIAPGFIETEMTSVLSEEVQAEHLKAIPLGRYGHADEIAGVVSFLASPAAGYVTGQVLGVNGGMYM